MADQKHLDILFSGIETWNQWRVDNPDIKPNLKNADLRGMDLGLGNFNNTDFSGAKLKNSEFFHSDFIRANLSFLDLRRTYLEKADFESALMTGVDLRGVHLSKVSLKFSTLIYAKLGKVAITDSELFRTNFSNSNMESAWLPDNRIRQCNFSNVTLTNSSFSREEKLCDNTFNCAKISNVGFNEVILTGSRFIGCELKNIDFHGADLSQVDFQLAKLTNVDFSSAKLERTKFIEAKGIPILHDESGTKINITFENAFLKDVNFKGALISNCSFTRSQIDHVNFNNVKMDHSNFSYANIKESCLSNSDFSFSTFAYSKVELSNAVNSIFSNTSFFTADLAFSDYTNSNFLKSDFSFANLTQSALTNSILNDSEFRGAVLLETNIDNAFFSGSHVYGICTWQLNGKPKKQINLRITDWGQSEITVDNLEIAQFIYLLLTNEKLKDIIDTITSKVVLILGSFVGTRKPVLELIKNELRNFDLTPIIFDFTVPSSRNLTETVGLLARMSRYIIVDISDPSSVPKELESIIPSCPTIPICPIFEKRGKSSKPYGMFSDNLDYPQVLDVVNYRNIDDIPRLLPKIHENANKKAAVIMKKHQQRLKKIRN